MLEFYAHDYVELGHQIGLLLASMNDQEADANAAGEKLSMLVTETSRLGLTVTKNQIDAMMLEVCKNNPEAFQLYRTGQTFQVGVDTESLSNERFCHHLETIYATMRSELGAMLFKAIPKERVRYSNSEWLKNSKIQTQFPTSFKELERAGICYSLGQPTAAVFHSMRALEPALTALASTFEISASHENWQPIINEIEGAIRKLGQQPKTPQKIEDEKFFGEAVTHLYFVKNAWRNHVMHTRDSHGDDEALKIMNRSMEFVESLCGRLRE